MNKKCVIHSSSLSSPFKLCELKSLWRRLKIKISTTSINARHECDIIKHNWILIERYSHQFSLINWTAHTHAREEEKFSIDRKDVMQKKNFSVFSLARLWMTTTTTRENFSLIGRQICEWLRGKCVMVHAFCWHAEND